MILTSVEMESSCLTSVEEMTPSQKVIETKVLTKEEEEELADREATAEIWAEVDEWCYVNKDEPEDEMPNKLNIILSRFRFCTKRAAATASNTIKNGASKFLGKLLPKTK